MQKKIWISTLAATGLVAAVLSTAAFAERGGPGNGAAGFGMMMGEGMPAFAEIDADGDGKVTPAEIDTWRSARMAGLDTDGDGMLSKEEVKASIQARMEARADRMVEGMFAARDSDGDGKLSAPEMALPAAPQRLFDRIDADKDGAITEAEVEAAQTRMAERMGEGRRGGHRGKPPMHGFFGQDN